MKKLRCPLPIAEGRAIVQLSSGEYVCVDTHTLDSIPYLIGLELEPEIIRVFRTFLTRRSVVLDIGANVGLYTALLSTAVRRYGQLFAFEGNPQVFAALQYTLGANELFFKPNIVVSNLLVSDKCGRGTLYYTAEAPVGGTMTDIHLWGGVRHSVEVDMTTIDAFLPPDLAVDLVKIDVEGHEPFVIRGMERTIARSPNIRLVIEFVDHMLHHTMKPPEFVDYIRSLGFGICRILPKFQIEPVAPGEEITGFNYLLLTRTPEADVAAVQWRRRYTPFLFKRWMSRHASWERYRRIWARF